MVCILCNNAISNCPRLHYHKDVHNNVIQIIQRFQFENQTNCYNCYSNLCFNYNVICLSNYMCQIIERRHNYTHIHDIYEFLSV